MQNANNQISVWKLKTDFLSGKQRKTITSPLFQFPTTVARFGSRLAVANAKFDTGFPPDRDAVRGHRRTSLTRQAFG